MGYDNFNKKLKSAFYRFRRAFLRLPLPQRIMVVLLALALCSFLIFGMRQLLHFDKTSSIIGTSTESTDTTKTADKIPGNYVRRHLDGVYVDPQNADYYPVAVMIDNDPNARPQAGLAQAQIVYEALMEGNITRFMAIFATASSTLPEIGPVRSARPYFVDWAQGYNALYAHVGGSPEALTELKMTAMYNINEFYQGKYFWRSHERLAPHNVLSSGENFYNYLNNLNVRSVNYRSWQYKDETAETHCQASACQNIDINYNNPLFAVSWQYDSEQNQYRRLMASSQHNDADGTPIAAKNVIVLKVPSQIVDAELRRHMQNIGAGKAWYCLDGACLEGSWKKASAREREVIYDDKDKEVKFNAGTTWIEVVQYDGSINVSNF